MKAFKYRSGSKRDLEGLKNNFLFVPHASKLNDPTENLFDESPLLNFVNQLENNYPSIDSDMNIYTSDLCRKLRENIGIFSLSKTQSDELLWAYYADSHRGFCIEYDLDKLQELNKIPIIFEVIYQKEIPKIDEKAAFKEDGIKDILKLTSGRKSEKWKHEEEIRACIEPHGIFEYDYRAINAIYFGLKMPKNNNELGEQNNSLPESYSKVSQNEVMRTLQGRDIKYFQMHLESNSYKIGYSEIEDPYKSASPYKTQNLGEVLDGAIDYNDYGENIERLYFDKVLEIIRKEPYCHQIQYIHYSKDESAARGEPIIFAGFLKRKDDLALTRKFFTLKDIEKQYSALDISEK